MLVFKKNESVYEEDIKLLKSEIYLSDLDIKELQRKLELATKEKDEVPLTIQNFKNSSKSLSKLLDIQIMDKCKIGLGYNTVPPPYTRNFMPPKPDLVYPSLYDFVDVNESVSESVVEKHIVETNEPKEVRKENDTLIIEDWVSDSDEEDVPKVKTVKMFNKPSFVKINFVKSTKQIKSPRKTSVNKNRQNTPSPRGNKRNWNQQMSQRLGSDFEIINKACHVCGSFDHLKNDYNNWCNNGRFAKPVWTNVQRGNPQQDLKDRGVIDSGCSRHMTGNKGYLTDYEEIDGGFVAFGGNSKRGRITEKGKIRTGGLDFEDVYFVKELKFNLFSVSQMCDKKNIVLFTDTECVVLSPDFKLTDESQVLLKVSRKDNMYNVDLKNVVPQGGFTCLFAKATPDESNIWNMRLGHVNFKIMNKTGKGKPWNGNESEVPSTKEPRVDQEKENDDNSTNNINTVSSTVNATSIKNNVADNNEASPFDVPNDLNMPDLEDICIFSDAEDDDVEADMSNLDIHIPVSPIPITRIHKDHPFTTGFALMDLPHGKRAIGTKWVYRNKKDERGIMIRNKTRLFLAYASYKDFMVYQMDVKSAFLYGKIEEEVYVYQPSGFEDPDFTDKVYKIEKALYGFHQAPRAWYVWNEILKKFGFSTVKIASTPMETSKPLMKDENAKDVDVYLYRSMIGSLMYLTSSMPDIMFDVRILGKGLKGQPKLGLWYPKDSPFDLEAYTDSDYASGSLDWKPTT
ncbi:putative ribonuclease H-like domain-containing protein [Tanacetum coccineum]|uniref:Ribonuclease H-like domain-containing protein n=1 Tax=Tanacetum coccineum TaxID=301880 RepID=A0ABQ5J757_9ASTR